MEVSGQLHAQATLFPVKEPPVPIGQEAGWAPEPVWTRWRREKFPHPRRESNPVTPIVQPLASRYTDFSILLPESVHRKLRFTTFIFCSLIYPALPYTSDC
jgi:hypothetical protein